MSERVSEPECSAFSSPLPFLLLHGLSFISLSFPVLYSVSFFISLFQTLLFFSCSSFSFPLFLKPFFWFVLNFFSFAYFLHLFHHFFSRSSHFFSLSSLFTPQGARLPPACCTLVFLKELFPYKSFVIWSIRRVFFRPMFHHDCQSLLLVFPSCCCVRPPSLIFIFAQLSIPSPSPSPCNSNKPLCAIFKSRNDGTSMLKSSSEFMNKNANEANG